MVKFNVQKNESKEYISHEGCLGLVVISLKAMQISSKSAVLLDIAPTRRYRRWVDCEGGPKSTAKHGHMEGLDSEPTYAHCVRNDDGT